ncbi:ankyrin repeat-containing protein [Anaeramoeba flamelloides]|uniref:Ankyrin repeat-containing protein n=1 Tax=Anaeramoeba flamelloides TaxID=1746091 RepID=A0ABQ8X9G5_9EUKA|nr:ankyrin repeat-containing protein [Anaeramoeba flamelloides]
MYQIKASAELFEILLKDPKQTTLQKALKNRSYDLNQALLYALDKKASLKIVKLLLEAGAKINYKDSNNDTPLNHALQVRSSSEIVKFLLECGSDPKRKNFTSKSSLYLSIEFENPVSVLSLLFSKENANVRLRLGSTPLHCSAKCRSSYEVVNFLLKLGSDPKLFTENGSLPLHLAVQHNAPLETIVLLIKAYKKGVNIPAKYGRNTLHLACQSESDPRVVERLLQKGAKVNTKDRFGRTPFQLLIKNKPKFRSVKLLIEAGAHFTVSDSDNNSCFHLLSTKKNANLKVLKYLLQFEIDLNLKNSFGLTCLHLAIMEKLGLEYIRLLVVNGADITIKTPRNHHCFSLAVISRNSSTVLQFFANEQRFLQNPKKFKNEIGIEKNFGKETKYIKKEKEKQKEKDKKKDKVKETQEISKIDIGNKIKKIKNFKIKHKNILQGKYRIKKNIKIKKINFNSLDFKGYNSLHLLSKYRADPAIIKLLIEKQVNVNQLCTEGYSPLLLAVLNQPRLEIIKLFVENGANIHQMDTRGNTCLHLSCQKNNLEMINFFLDKGLDPNLKNSNSSTPLQISILTNKDLSVIKLLLKYGGDLNIVDKFSHNCLELSILSRVDSEIILYILNCDGVNLYFKNKNDRSILDLAIRGRFETKVLINMIERGISYNNDFIKDIVPSDSEKFKMIKSANSLCHDMLRLFERAEKTDLIINEIKVHRLIIELRLETNHTIVKNILEKNYDHKQTKLFLKWVYDGQINENLKLITQVCKYFPSIDTKSKSLRSGIVKDLKHLYNQENTKNFSIIIKKKKINVHKLILQARSETFRGMLINVSENSKVVHDYTGMSEIALEKIFEFIYCDSFDVNSITQETIDEINEFVDYYQLNEFSRIEWIFDKNLIDYF